MSGSNTVTQSANVVQTSAVFNELGLQVSSVDGAGNRSYKVYDGQGQVAYEIDSLGQVTAYGRDAFGQVTSLKRFAKAINIAAGTLALSKDEVESRLTSDPSQDREILTSYDQLGHVLEVREPSVFYFDPSAAAGQHYFTAGKVTRNTYNAFGELTQVATSAQATNAITDTWSYVSNYYDKRGQRVATVDAAAYLTTFSYDAQGNTIGQCEYAQALQNWSPVPVTELVPAATAAAAESAQDRITVVEYDLNNRLNKQSFADRQHLALENGQHVTVNEYDAVGHVTVSRAWGVGASSATLATRKFYDALGRVDLREGSFAREEAGRHLDNIRLPPKKMQKTHIQKNLKKGLLKLLIFYTVSLIQCFAQ